MICDLQILFGDGVSWVIELPVEDAADLINVMMCKNTAAHWSDQLEAHDIYIDTNKVAVAQITNVREGAVT